MKSFLGGLALATAMALLSGTATPQPSVCFVFPRFESAVTIAATEDTCSTVCAVRRARH